MTDGLRFDEVKKATLDAAGDGLDAAGALVLAEANRRFPTLTGRAEATGKVSRDGLEVAVSYDTDYVVDVHEDMQAFHDDGSAKFLENAANAKRSELAKAVAARIRAQLGT